MYKYVHNDLPFTLLLNIFQYSHQIHEHDTRYSNEPRPYKCRTQTVYFVTDQKCGTKSKQTLQNRLSINIIKSFSAAMRRPNPPRLSLVNYAANVRLPIR